MDNLINTMLKNKSWAVVGATNKQEKYGYKVYKKLLDYGYDVYPVNPRCDEINNNHCYDTIKDVKENIECISLIVNPKLAKEILKEINHKGIKYVWAQPGAYNEEIIIMAKELGINLVYGKCILIELK